MSDSTISALDLNTLGTKRLKVVLDALPVAISWAELEGSNIVFMNRKFTELFGYTLGDFPTVPDWVAHAYPNPEQVRLTEAAWFKFFENPTKEEFQIGNVEIDVLCKDQSVKTCLVGGVILPEAGWALATFSDISDRKRDELIIQSLAQEDSLTGLVNRRSFDLKLQQALNKSPRDGHMPNLLLLDLDNFKGVNDTFGHLIGDEVLIATAKRLKQCVRSEDVVARIGGDEFAIILDNLNANVQIERICKDVIHSIAQPFTIENKTITIGISIGVSDMLDNKHTAHDVLSIADKGLYLAKHEGRNCWRLGYM